MSVWICVGLAIACSVREAAAERAVVVDAVGVAFDPRELAAALRLRLAADGAAVHLRVIATPRGVRVEAPRGARELALGGLDGAAAVRLIALTAGDLLLDDLAIVPPPPEARAAVALGLLGGVAAWDGGLGDVAVDVTLPRGGWLVAIELGGGQLLDGELGLTTMVARLDAGLRRGPLELRAGLTAAPVFVTRGAGDQTVLVGGNASARLRLPVAAAMRVIVAAGCDAFATRTEYRVAGRPALATPQLAPWLAAGVEVDL